MFEIVGLAAMVFNLLRHKRKAQLGKMMGVIIGIVIAVIVIAVLIFTLTGYGAKFMLVAQNWGLQILQTFEAALGLQPTPRLR